MSKDVLTCLRTPEKRKINKERMPEERGQEHLHIVDTPQDVFARKKPKPCPQRFDKPKIRCWHYCADERLTLNAARCTNLMNNAAKYTRYMQLILVHESAYNIWFSQILDGCVGVRAPRIKRVQRCMLSTSMPVFGRKRLRHKDYVRCKGSAAHTLARYPTFTSVQQRTRQVYRARHRYSLEA